MAATSPQGSKAGIIFCLVMFAVLFFAALFTAIYFNSKLTLAAGEATNERTQRLVYASDGDLTNADVQKYAKAAELKHRSVVQELIAERSELAKAITGNPTSANDLALTTVGGADKYAQGQLDSVKSLGITLPMDLANQIHVLSDAVVKVEHERAAAEAAAAAAAKATVEVTSARDAMLKEKDDKIAEAVAASAKATADADAYKKDKDNTLTQVQADADQKQKDLQAAAEKLQQQLTERDGQVKVLLKKVDVVTRRLATTRVNVTDAMIQRSDGTVLRAATQNTVFIDIGQQQSVTPGLTFEVYDRQKGIPPLGNGMRDAELPAGKASIEVIRVLPTSSECRVIHTQLGETITEGDLIMNLVYDPNAHYKFMVYGNFDVSNTGTPTASDADVIKRLVTQWGGRLTDQANVDTDFIVLGAEPVVPTLSQEDQNDPAKVKRHDDANAAFDAYTKVEAQAAELGIPIMNQNRFLYFVGYYDQASK